MTNLSFPQFARGCENSGIALHPDLVAKPHQTVGYCYQPGEWYGAAATAGALLREDPELELTDAPIAAERLGEGTPTVAQLAVRSILNASLDRVPGTNPATSFFCGSPPVVNSCSKAEEGFAATIEDMVALGEGKREPKQGWTLIIDDDRPVAVTKTHGDRSTLSFETFYVNGIPYPAGSLFRAMASRSVRFTEAQRITMPSVMLAFVGFLRLSAYAAEPKSRGVFESTGRPNASPVLRTWPLDRMREISRQVLVHSDVVY